MRIIAQSQAPAKPGYIHLAYISAQLSNWILSEGRRSVAFLGAVKRV